MTGLELYNRLQSFGDLQVDSSVVVGWIDTCQKEISIERPVVDEVTVLAVSVGTTKLIATGVLSFISAKYTDSTGEYEYPLSALSINKKSIVFGKAANSVTVRYSSIAPDYTNISDELTVDVVFHAPMLYYLISMYYEMEGEGDIEEGRIADKYYQRWMYNKSIALGSLMSSDQESSSMAPVETTDVMPRTRRQWGDDFYE